jgi:predicted secreted Zn-dependent protease
MDPASAGSEALPTPLCNVDTSPPHPSAIPPNSPGYLQVVDAPDSYTVYGNTPEHILDEIAECTPISTSGTNGTTGKYAAATADTIAWSVSYNSAVGNICTISNVEVTLHIKQVFPSWQASDGTNNGLKLLWQTYLSKLKAYEQGHVNLDEQSAVKLYRDLSSTIPTNCSQIDAVVNQTVNVDIANNNLINTRYDISNDYGFKQGVIL